MLFFFALPFAYPLLYAFIYNTEVVYDVPLAVVDNSRTQLSREMCRRIDASPNTEILSYCANLDEAKELMYKRDCFGILEIPGDFDKKLARGEQSPVIFYSDMSLLLNYKNFLITLTDVSLDMGKELQSRTLTGATPAQIDMVTDPIPSFSFVLYNPSGGFASFIIPALLVVILQQSIILGIGILAGGLYEHRKLRHLLPKSGENTQQCIAPCFRKSNLLLQPVHRYNHVYAAYHSLAFRLPATGKSMGDILFHGPVLAVIDIFRHNIVGLRSRTRKRIPDYRFHLYDIPLCQRHYMALRPYARNLANPGRTHSLDLGCRRFYPYEYRRSYHQRCTVTVPQPMDTHRYLFRNGLHRLQLSNMER